MIEILQQAAGEAGETLISHFRKGLSATQKLASHQNLVTQADVASQSIIKRRLTELCATKGIDESEIGFIGEENLATPGKHIFVIDPLDGTNNFASGHDYFCISIGYFVDGKHEAGLIYHPVSGTYYSAQKGKGSFKTAKGTTERMNIRHAPIKESLLLSYMSSREATRQEWLPIVTKLHSASRGLRIHGALALDSTHFSDRQNNFNIVLNAHAYMWDIAAAKIIVEEAGGSFTDWQGNPLTLDLVQTQKGYRVLICHPQNLKELVSVIKSS
jgi:myo-inositol-1(or 4)-monophosphatase